MLIANNVKKIVIKSVFPIFLILIFSSFSIGSVFVDNFDSSHDYLISGTAGTGWDGFVGLGAEETVDELNASIDRVGQLYIESTYARWEPDWNPLGPFLYKVVDGDFIATVRVTEFAGCPTPRLEHNDSGLMARVADLPSAGDGEDAMTVQYFATWSGNIYRIIDDGGEDELGATGDGCSCASYLQLERAGDLFYCRISQNGTDWTELSGSPVTRTDMSDLPVQVGLWHCTYSSNTGYVAFDDFELTYLSAGSASNPNPPDDSEGVEPPVTLSWTAADEAHWHDVYIGDNYSDVNNEDNSEAPCSGCIYRARQSAANTSYAVADELLPDETYYWRIDEIDSEGDLLGEKGEVWSFTVKGYKASEPTPENNASGIELLTTLNWESGLDADMHDIFFGDNYNDVLNAKRLYGDIDMNGDVDANDLSILVTQWLGGPCGGGLCADIYPDDEVNFKDFCLLADTYLLSENEIYKGSQAEGENSYSPGLLSPSKTYYWRIDEADFDGAGTTKGDVWSFITSAGGPINISNDYFELTFDMSNGGFTKVQRTGDNFETNFVSNPGWLIGDIETTYRIGAGSWQDASTYNSDDNRNIEINQDGQKTIINITYPTSSGHPEGIRDFEVSQYWVLDGNNLTLDVNIVNTTGSTLELGDLAFPLPFNSNYNGLDTDTIQTKRVLRHGFFSGHASHCYWTRVNGVPAFLVMTTPSSDTRFEYWDNISNDTHFRPFVYSAITGPAEAGTWRQQHTSRVLSAGETINLKFNFTWADSLREVRDVLYEDNDIDIECVPGMTIPQDTYALVKLRTKQTIDSVVAEYPGDTVIQYIGETQTDTHIYKITFNRLGENIITVNHNGSETTNLEFFGTEPLETLYKKRSSHMANYEQVVNPAVWYDGLFGEWDLRTSVLRTPDNTDGMDLPWWIYVICCDDPGNAHAPFLAGKNVRYPVQAEIDALEYYIDNYVWGGLQYTDTEAYPYRVLGVPTWYYNRSNDPTHYGRVFDYPHIVMLYYHMYQIAKYYPDMVSYLDADGYLNRAYNTAMQYYQVSGGWGYEVGTYNEVVFVDLINSLREEGWNTEADALEDEWDQKVKYFIFDKEYPYGSEYAMDSTAFESTHALVKWAMENGLDPDPQHPVINPAEIEEFMHGQMMANLAVRGCIEPAFYTYGSDYRSWGQRRYTLSYMSQMGGWAVLDYGLKWTDNPLDYIRLGYGSYLSSWALMNSDPTGTNGYWYPSAQNDGAIGWAFKPEKNGPMWLQSRYLERGIWYYNGEIDLGLCGALRTAKAIVVNDPVFGLYGYGCDVVLNGGDYEVVLKDGLRERLIMHNLGIELKLNRDSFAAGQDVVISEDKDSISFTLENERLIAHTTTLNVSGLIGGIYSVKINDIQQYTVTISGPSDVKQLDLSIGTSSTYEISVSSL